MSLMGFKARNHPQAVAKHGADDSIDDQRTPDSVFVPLDREHHFTIDVAASAENAKCARFFTREDDGLAQSWVGERVWCNPPYSNIEAWVKKASLATRRQFADRVVMLLPANRTEQRWWQEHVEEYRDRCVSPFAESHVRVTTRFLPGRIRFGRAEGVPLPKKGDRPPFGLVVVTWRRVVP